MANDVVLRKFLERSRVRCANFIANLVQSNQGAGVRSPREIFSPPNRALFRDGTISGVALQNGIIDNPRDDVAILEPSKKATVSAPPLKTTVETGYASIGSRIRIVVISDFHSMQKSLRDLLPVDHFNQLELTPYRRKRNFESVNTWIGSLATRSRHCGELRDQSKQKPHVLLCSQTSNGTAPDGLRRKHNQSSRP